MKRKQVSQLIKIGWNYQELIDFLKQSKEKEKEMIKKK